MAVAGPLKRALEPSAPVTVAEGSIEGEHGSSPAIWHLAEETPVAVMLNSRSLAVMMATPSDLEDFAIGFAICEGYLASAEAVRNILVLPTDGGVAVDLAVDEDAILARPTRRTMEGRSGCGLCGVEEIAQVVRELPPIGYSVRPATDAVLHAFGEFRDHQPMNRLNHSVHAAAWADLSGKILLAREDVGRHCALDKLIGALCRQGIDRSAGFLVMSSRISFEIVQKSAAVGIAAIAAVSAPTSLAVSLAGQAGIDLATSAGGNVMRFERTLTDA